jgi:acylphosphatase
MVVAARHLMIHGKVQGVWYRAWTVETARGLGLVGWVRNRADGCVEAVIEGDSGTVDQFIALADRGPPAAQVTRIDVRDYPVDNIATFEKRPTV